MNCQDDIHPFFDKKVELPTLATLKLVKPLWGIGDYLFNRRHASKETKISPKTVSKLSLKWEFYAGKDKLRLRIEDPPRRKHLGGAVLAGIMIYEGTYAMNKNADFETAWEIKEKLCYVRNRRFQGPEALFSPELIEVEGDGKADMVFCCFQEMDIDNIMDASVCSI
ncbi:hypothetical protein Q3G72_019620 [Acer saccharum]|nr:hypothetical protein Q3G72_019620 [Acer saccharum]